MSFPYNFSNLIIFKINFHIRKTQNKFVIVNLRKLIEFLFTIFTLKLNDLVFLLIFFLIFIKEISYRVFHKYNFKM